MTPSAWTILGASLCVVGACSSPSTTGSPSAGTLPSASTPPAPATAPGAEQAWNDLRAWRDQEAVTCSFSVNPWPEYSCVQQIYDPRRIADYGVCMQSRGCDALHSDDPCLFDPPTPVQTPTLSADVQAWLDSCLLRHTECSFKDDLCGAVLEALIRPELRASLRACVEGPCADVASCATAVMATVPDCWQ